MKLPTKPLTLYWLDRVRERQAADEADPGSYSYNDAKADARALVHFVDVLLDQLVTDEKRRAAVVRASEGEPITWTCHICGDRRPDHFISVAHRKVDMTPTGHRQVVQINARYCNDRSDCLRKASDELDAMAAPMLTGASRS
jgi:hypothetical protein